MLAVFARIEPALRKSITFDNDTAFAQHALLRTMRAMTTCFCDAYASWQKGRGRKRQRSITTLVASSDRHRPSVRRRNSGHRHHRQSHAQKVPGLQDPFPGDPQRAWQRRANPVRIALLHLVLESRPHSIQDSSALDTNSGPLSLRRKLGAPPAGRSMSRVTPWRHGTPFQANHGPKNPGRSSPDRSGR